MGNKTEISARPIGKNRLANENSPYLLQHADNPVDWYPWGDEAFEKARSENKPIFLSIGYSTCHWCHVMEHESFEDDSVAALMNDAFVSIKVDREERPDLDNIYMTAARLLKNRGGWPLTILMTPDKKPFFAATYIPKESQYGRVGMLDFIPQVKEVWQNQNDDIIKSADQLVTALQKSSRYTQTGQLDKEVLNQAFQQFSSSYDEQYGGFGSSPKFPTPHNFLYLLRYWKRSGDPKALEMVEKTLQAMRRGGIYDHVGYGFHRYSTDREWLLPHFEKMLYDQALLAMAFVETYQVTGKDEYAQTAREIFEYIIRDMTDPKGGFYSAEDADSEGEEGKFYVWNEDEVKQVLGEEDGELFLEVYNFQSNGNFNEQATGKETGDNIIYLTKAWPELAKDMGFSRSELQTKMNSALKRLFDVREKRIHPYKDDKILTDWNGLMIAALAMGGRVLDEPRYQKAAERAADFIIENMRDKKGRLMHRYRGGEAGIESNLDDHAFLIWGLIELYETGFDVKYLKSALEINDKMITHFWDDLNNGFYFSADDGEQLLVRQKEIYDGAVPSGNSVAAYNLLRLGRITANSELEKKAELIGNLFLNEVKRAPTGFTMLLIALDFGTGSSYEIVISGNDGADDTKEMIKILNTRFLPNKVVVFRPDVDSPEIAELAEYIDTQAAINGKATIYVCRNYACGLPTTNIDEMLKQMAAME